jgi:hypothetical protein
LKAVARVSSAYRLSADRIALGGDVDGLYGLWHRLWAALSMAQLWGSPEFEDLPVALRAQFESLLGRAMTDEEYAMLAAHAHQHS